MCLCMFLCVCVFFRSFVFTIRQSLNDRPVIMAIGSNFRVFMQVPESFVFLVTLD